MITRGISRTRRPAFTLLEVILALSIGLILLSALYFLLSTQLRMTQMGRDVLDESTVSRAVINRIRDDVQSTLSPIDLRVVPDYAAPVTDSSAMDSTTDMSTTDSSGATPSGTSTSGTTSSGTTSSGTSSSGTSSSGTSSSSTKKTTTTTTTTTVRNTVDFNVGVDGGASYLILTVARPQRLSGATGAEASGLRRIIYWIVPGERGGLARYEIKNATGEDVNLQPNDVPSPEDKVIAPEVAEISFEYFDGSGWPTSWNGFAPAGDLNSPTGPPSAIRMTMKIRRRSVNNAQTTLQNPEDAFIQVQHVVAIPNGNHFPQEGS